MFSHHYDLSSHMKGMFWGTCIGAPKQVSLKLASLKNRVSEESPGTVYYIYILYYIENTVYLEKEWALDEHGFLQCS